MMQATVRPQNKHGKRRADLVTLATAADGRADWVSSAGLWGECLSRFPHDPERDFWLRRKARALTEVGAVDKKLYALTSPKCNSFDQPSDYEALADLASACHEWALAAAYLTRCIDASPSHPNLSTWLSKRGRALLKACHYHDAGASFEALLSEPCTEHQGLEGLARRAELQWNWTKAIDYWNRYIAKAPEEYPTHAIARKAYCLLEIGRVNEARDLFNSIGDSVEGLEGLARIATVQDLPDIAEKSWDECIRRFPNNPSGFLEKAGFLLNRQCYAQADTLLSSATTMSSDCIAGRALRARCATAAENWQAAGERWNELLTGHAGDSDVMVGYAHYLAKVSDRTAIDLQLVELGERTVAKAEFLLEYFAASEDYGRAAQQARKLVDLENEKLAHRFRLAKLLMHEGSPEALHAAVWILRELYDRSPESVAIKTQLAESFIRSDLDQQAKILIETLPADDRRSEIEVLRAWLLHRSKDKLSSKRLWSNLLRRDYMPAIHVSADTLARVDDNDSVVKSEDILLLTVIRDERSQLPRFLNYYKTLGIDKFIIVDNTAAGGSQALLLDDRQVFLYRATDSFSIAGNDTRWINGLIDRHGQNNWCVYVNVDERLIFPCHTSLGLRGLTAYLSHKGHEALRATLLDLYSANIANIDLLRSDWDQLSDLFFDNALFSYQHPICPYIETYGGVRRRRFNGYQPISTVPLVNGHAGIQHLFGSHRTTPATMSDITGILLNYNLVDDFDVQQIQRNKKSERPKDARIHFSAPQFRDDLERDSTSFEALLCDSSVRFESMQQLLRLGLAQANDTFLAFGDAATVARASLKEAFG